MGIPPPPSLLDPYPAASLPLAPGPQVKEYEASASLFAETRAKRTELQASTAFGPVDPAPTLQSGRAAWWGSDVAGELVLCVAAVAKLAATQLISASPMPAHQSAAQEAMKEFDGEIKALRQEMDVQVQGGGRLFSGGANKAPWPLSCLPAAAACSGWEHGMRWLGTPWSGRSAEGAMSSLLRRTAVRCLQRQILDKLREHERGIDAEVEEIITERRRCREVMVSLLDGRTGLAFDQNRIS